VQPLACSRVQKTEDTGMERLAPEIRQGRPPGSRQAGAALRRFPAINGIAQQGISRSRQMDPDLMGPAGG
jgi:hypothetical protein